MDFKFFFFLINFRLAQLLLSFKIYSCVFRYSISIIIRMCVKRHGIEKKKIENTFAMDVLPPNPVHTCAFVVCKSIFYEN